MHLQSIFMKVVTCGMNDHTYIHECFMNVPSCLHSFINSIHYLPLIWSNEWSCCKPIKGPLPFIYNASRALSISPSLTFLISQFSLFILCSYIQKRKRNSLLLKVCILQYFHNTLSAQFCSNKGKIILSFFSYIKSLPKYQISQNLSLWHLIFLIKIIYHGS